MVLKTHANGWPAESLGISTASAPALPGARTTAGGRSRGEGATSQMQSSRRSIPDQFGRRATDHGENLRGHDPAGERLGQFVGGYFVALEVSGH